MIVSSIIEKPSLFAIIAAILAVVVTVAIDLLADINGKIHISSEALLYSSGLIISITVGLSAYIFALSKKLNKAEERRLRIQAWRDHIDSSSSFDDFYNSQSFLEINTLLTKKELKKYKNISSNRSIDVIAGSSTHVVTQDQRIFNFYQEVIFRIEKKWSLI